MSRQPGVAYKVLTKEQWLAFRSAGAFTGAPVDVEDGYIHLSAAEQVAGTLDKHFAGQDGLQVVAVDLGALAELVRWEVSRSGALFPHVYGALPMAAVLAHGPVVRKPDGTVDLGFAG